MRVDAVLLASFAAQMSHAAAVEEEEAPAAATFASLPAALMCRIFERLPADARARAKCVSTGWAATLADVRLWTRLDLSAASGVTCTINDAALRGASGLARGRLTALDVSGCWKVTPQALLAVVAVNAGALTEVHAHFCMMSSGDARALLYSAPLLHVFHADVRGDESVQLLLRNAPPFGPLRIRLLRFEPSGFSGADTEAAAVALAAAVAAHASLRSLCICHTYSMGAAAALDAVVDAALAARMESLTLHECLLTPEALPALARLLSCSRALTALRVVNSDGGAALFDAPGAALLGAALRGNSTLTSLSLVDTGLLCDADVATTLLGALTGHASLRALDISRNTIANAPTVSAARVAAAAALRLLVAANAPVLTQLNLTWCRLPQAALAPLFHALPTNTHLRALDCSGHDISDAFVREVLLPAVRANKALRELTLVPRTDAAMEAMALVRARAAAAEEEQSAAQHF